MPQISPAQQRELLAALRLRLEADMAQAFLDAIIRARSSINVGALAELIRAGRIADAADMVVGIRALLFPLDDQLRRSFIEGGIFAASVMPLLRNPLNATSFTFAFDGRHSRAEAWSRVRAADLITNIMEDQRIAARAAIADGISTNRQAVNIARDLVGSFNRVTGKREGGIIGLTSPQTDLIIKAREALYSGTKTELNWYLGLKTRSRTYDAMIIRAIEGTPLTKDQIETILGAHKSKMLRIRGEMVARNEVFTALSAGQNEGWKQLIESGAAKAADVTKRWQHNHNNPFRPKHLAMNGTTIAFDQAFDVGGTRMMHDHDPAGGPDNNIGCHCTTFYRLRKGRDLG